MRFEISETINKGVKKERNPPPVKCSSAIVGILLLIPLWGEETALEIVTPTHSLYHISTKQTTISWGFSQIPTSSTSQIWRFAIVSEITSGNVENI